MASVHRPGTRFATRTARGGRLGVQRTEFVLSHLGVSWDRGPAHVRLGTPAGWSGWRTLRSCDGGSALLVASGAVAYELRTPSSDAAQTVELNTVDTVATATATATASMPLPGGASCPVPYLSRQAWGADESLRFPGGAEDFPPEYHPVQALTVHHSAGANNDPDPAATVRAIYYYQAVTNGWGDIGYHLLIDEAGVVYEGRWSGADPVPIFGTAGMSTGAHVADYNPGNIGICLLGDLTSQSSTPAARQSLVRVLAALARTARLDPFGTTGYVNPVTGAAKTVRTICGHRDWAATQCPGNTFYPQLDAIRNSVANAMIPAVPRRTAEPVAGAPAPRRV